MYKIQCIITCSQSDYLVNSAGTEKFIREMYNLLKEQISMVHIFPVTIVGKKYLGINVDGRFYGLCKINDIEKILTAIAERKRYRYCGVHLQHIAGWDKRVLDKLMDYLNLPVVLFVHDTYMICPKLNSVNGGLDRTCSYNIKIPSEILCSGCEFSEVGVKEYRLTSNFLDNNNERIVRVVAPSELALNNWLSVYPHFREKSVVRPHLVYTSSSITPHHNEKIRIAYLGVHNRAKGYDVWGRVVNNLSIDNFDFYCFSRRPSDQDNVKSVYTDYIDRTGKKVQDLLEEYKIDIVFLWSIVQETYSYTYYEATEAGCYVITNEHSGNIACQTKKNSNGKVFETEKQCLEWLQNQHNIKRELEYFWTHGGRISEVKPNRNVEEVMFFNKNTREYQGKSAIKCRYVISLIYYIKSRCKTTAIKVVNNLYKIYSSERK